MDHTHLVAASAGAAAALAIKKLIPIFGRGRAQKSKSNDSPSNGPVGKSLWGQPPHPEWQPPAKLPPPYNISEGWHDIDPAETAPGVLYPLVISSIVPRPIAFVTTIGPDGSRNLAPFSYFNTVGHDPPMVTIGFSPSRMNEHGRKDTLFNILETKEFVVNIISEWFVEAANHCCGNFPYGTDEMQLSGLTPVESLRVKPPRVAESGVQLECRLLDKYDAKNAEGKVTATVVLGEVVMWHVAKGVAGKSPTGKLIVDVEKLAPISRLGGNTYGRTSGLFDLPRPDR